MIPHPVQPPRHAGGRLLNLPDFAPLAWALGHRAVPEFPGGRPRGAAWDRQRSEDSADAPAAGRPARRRGWLVRLRSGPWAVWAGPGELAPLAAGGPPNTPTTPGGTGGADPASMLLGSLATPQPKTAQRAWWQRLGRAAAPSWRRTARPAADAPAGLPAPVESARAVAHEGGRGSPGTDFVIPAFRPPEAAGARTQPEPGGRAVDGSRAPSH